MSRVSTMDARMDHLYPPFRRIAEVVLQRTAEATGEQWEMVEGHRSVQRQLWLYGQGRPHVRPYGRAGSIVTWKRSPTWHGTGIALDARPKRVRSKGYAVIPHSHWEKYRQVYTAYAREIGEEIGNPAWRAGDYQHLQWTDKKARLKALAWVAAGFPDTDTPKPPSTEIVVVVNGTVIPHADGYMKDGRCRVWVRPVVQAMGWEVLKATKTKATVVLDDDTPEREGTVRELPIRVEEFHGQPHGMIAVHDLTKLGVQAEWDSRSRRVTITETAHA